MMATTDDALVCMLEPIPPSTQHPCGRPAVSSITISGSMDLADTRYPPLVVPICAEHARMVSAGSVSGLSLGIPSRPGQASFSLVPKS